MKNETKATSTVNKNKTTGVLNIVEKFIMNIVIYIFIATLINIPFVLLMSLVLGFHSVYLLFGFIIYIPEFVALFSKSST